MRRLLFFLLCLSAIPAAAQISSSQKKELDAKLAEYLEAIKTEPLSSQYAEADFLIGSCKDSLVKQYVALNLYSHFMESKLMGAENVAVHIFDRWFSDGTVKMQSEVDELNARLFSQLNHPSLIGETTPEIYLEGTQMKMYAVPDAESRRYGVLFFYDIDCAKCRMEAIMLRNVLENTDFPVDVYAVYLGKDEKRWRSYIAEELTISTVNTKLMNFWNPSGDTDALSKYGILQTPKMFLFNPERTIIGRSLDSMALSQMLQNIFTSRQLGYGDDESHAFFDRILGNATSPSEITRSADEIARKCLVVNGDTTLFRQMSGDLLYYLSSQRKEPYISGCNYLIDKYILTDNKVWKTPDDSLKVIGLATMLRQLYAKAPVGQKIPDIRLYGTLVTPSREESGLYRLGRLGAANNFIIFHNPDCPVCEAQIEAGRKSLRKGQRLFLVNMEQTLRHLDQEHTRRLMDSFDLSALPYITQTDRKGVVVKKYVTF